MIFNFWSYMKKMISTDDLTPKVNYGCPKCRSENIEDLDWHKEEE